MTVPIITLHDGIEDAEYDTIPEMIADHCYNNFISTSVSIGGGFGSYSSQKINLDEVVVDLTLSDGGSAISTSGPQHCNDTISMISNITKEMIIPYADGHKLRHELVSQVIYKGATDINIGQVFDMDINKTPDFLFYCQCSNPFYLAIEVSTTTNDKIAYSRAFNKLHSYHDSLCAVSNFKGVRFFLAVIIVTPYSTISNVFIDQQTANKLSMMWNIGEQLYHKGVSLGLFSARVLDEDETLDNIAMSILKNITTTPYMMPVKKEMMITQDYLKKVRNTQPNLESCKKHFTTAIQTTMTSLPKLINQDQKVSDFNMKTKDYFDQCDKEAMIKFKSVINLPLVLSGNSGEVFVITKTDSELPKLWDLCIQSYYKSESRVPCMERARAHVAEALCDIQIQVTEYEEERKRLRKAKDYPNILKQIPSIEQYLQCDGLWAKGTSDPVVSQKRKIAKVPISSMSPVDDIGMFLENQEIYKGNYVWDDNFYRAVELLDHSGKLVGNTSTIPSDFIKTVADISLFQSLLIMSNIATELNAELQHHIRRGTLIVKKIPNMDIFLAIYPTKSKEHIFVSIFMPKTSENKVLCGLPFRQCEETEDGYFFPFVSFKQHKLKNLILAPFMFINLLSFWLHYHDIPILDFDFNNLHKGVVSMTNYCLLVMLEDKSRTEEIITLSRYFYVDLMNCQGRIPIHNPAKLVSKLPTVFRTRLELFSCKRLLEAVSMMLQNPPVKTASEISDDSSPESLDDISKDSFSGLINFVNGEYVPTGAKIVQIMYIGYLVNKNKLTDKNSDFAMVKKLISASLAVTKEDVKNQGEIHPGSTPKSQQFSLECIVTGAHYLKEELSLTYGRKWQDTLMSNICKNLSKHMTHEIATLKASCLCTLENIQKGDTSELLESRKVLETISKHIDDFGLNPFVNIVKIIEQLENEDLGLLIKLFKKNQHGGLREISILEIRGRIVALFIETISRTICSEFEYEVLTHPENKLRLLESHKIDMYDKAKSNGAIVIESCNSSDKTKWNQNFTMHALISGLLCFLPESCHNILARSFNLWVNKHILLPPSVLKLLEENTELRDDIYKLLQKQYNGDLSDDCIPIFDKHRSAFINIQTCMMQGILHYTSSLLHTISISLSKKLIKSYFTTSYVTGVVTSDDSAIISSLIVPKSTNTRTAKTLKFALDIIMISIEEFTRWLCMTPSVKSVLACSHFVEFNSEFIIGNNLVVPTIKYVISGLNLSESESLIHRYDTLYNQMSDIFAKGLPAQNTLICQYSQGLLHYHSLGMNNNLLFEEFSDRIMKYPEPSLGFFPIDNEFIPGIMGLSYSSYHIRKNGNILKLPSKAMASNDVSVHKTGMISTNYILKMGDYKRHDALIQSVSGTDREHAEIDISSNPRLIYTIPKNDQEIKCKLAMKSLAPGVANSLKHGDEFIKAFQSSVYGTFTHCFTKLSSIRRDDKIEKTSEKVSIIGELHKLINERNDDDGSIYFTTADKTLLRTAFPNYQLYDEVADIFSKLRSKTKFVTKKNRRSRKCKVIISSPIFHGSITFLEMVRYKWWGIPINASENRIALAWNEFKLANPWLSDTCEESLELSPFGTHLSLFYYISSISTKNRRVLLNCPPIRAKKFTSQLLSIAKRCVGTNIELSTSESTSKYIPLVKNMTSLYLATCLPDDTARREMFGKYSKEVVLSKDDLANTDKMHYKDVELIHLISYTRGIINSKELLNFFFDKGHGMMVSYVKEQKKKGRRYVGNGIVMLRTRTLLVKLTIDEDKVIKIETNNTDAFLSMASLINEKVKFMKLCFDSSFYPGLVYVSSNVMSNCQGTKFIETPLEDQRILDYEQLVIRPEHMKIITYQKINGKLIPISTLKTHDMCISNLETSRTNYDRWIEAWCEMATISSDDAISYLKASLRDDGWESSFLKTTFTKRYGFRHSHMTNLPAVVATMSSKANICEEDIIKNALAAIGNLTFLEDIPVEASVETLDDIENFPIDLFSSSHTFDTTILDHYKESFMALHPMWDKLISTLNPRLVEKGSSTDQTIAIIHEVLYGRGGYREVVPKSVSWRT
jgi:hypothetical protein